MTDPKVCPRCGRRLVLMKPGWRCVGCSRTPNDCDCPRGPAPIQVWP